MARISTYIKDDRVSVKDKVIGSDGDNSNQTKNFSITGISDFILGQLKNSGVVFRFADTSVMGLPIGEEGYFFSEGNVVDKTLVTKFYFSKQSYFGETLTELFTSVGSNLGDLYLGLSQQDDSANYGFFNVANIVSVNNEYFEVEATLRGSMFAKDFQLDKNYSLFFDLASSNEYDIDIVGGVFQLKKNGAVYKTQDLSVYLDDTNLARLTSGSVDGNGIATFVRDDATSFTVDFSTFLSGMMPTKTSDLINDGEDGVNPFVSSDEVYIKSEVDNKDAFIQTQVTKLNGLYLELDTVNDQIHLKNADGDILSSIADTGADGIGYSIEFDSESRSIFLKDKDGNVVDSIPISVFMGDKLDRGGYEGTAADLYNEILLRATNTYVDTQDAATEAAANSYTDAQIAALDLDFVRSVNNIFPDVNGNVTVEVYDIPRDGTYADVTAMIADQNNQQEGFIYEVTDASADPNPDIDEGKAWYWYEGTTTGTISDYTLLSSEDLQNLTTQELFNKIGYTPANVTVTDDHESRITILEAGEPETRMISFDAFYDTGMTYQVVASWYFEGQYYNTGGSPDPVTLSDGDPVNDRIDVIAVDSTGNVVVIEGTPDANPSKPEIDPATQLEGTFIFIEAGATTPKEVTESFIYNENVGTGGGEWNTTENTGSTTIAVNSTTNPYSGATHIEGTTVNKNDHIQFTAGSPIPVGDITQVSFRIKNVSGNSIPANPFQIVIVGRDSAGNTINYNTDPVSSFGFSNTNITDYQFVSFPVPQSTAMIEVTGLRFIMTAKPSVNWSFRIDVVEAISGTTPPISGGVDKEYVDYRDQTILQLAKDYADGLQTGSDKNYYHNQSTPSATWNITHNLSKYPSVTVFDSGGSKVIGDVDHIDINSLTISFSASFSGQATLN